MLDVMCRPCQFCGLLTVVFVLELSAGITGYILKNSTYSLITAALKPTMPQYINNTRIAIGELRLLILITVDYSIIAVGWDNIQETYRCCGLNSDEDWIAAVNGTPLSCCDIPHGHLDMFVCNSTQETLHQSGCVQAFGDFIKSHALSLALVGVILAAIQLIGLLFACLIAQKIKKNRGF